MQQSTFLRREKKYLISPAQKDRLMSPAAERLIPAEYADSLVISVYLDTPDFSMIGRSVEAGFEGSAYKEKLRLRCYGEAKDESRIFFEVKKKYLGMVSKRRIATDLSGLEAYFREGILPEKSQIMSELDYTMRKNGQPRPVMLIAYDRQAFVSPDDPELRVTFDRNVRFRTEDLDPRLGTAGRRILPPQTLLLEIKTAGSMPLWLAKALDEADIRPASFSKAGAALKIISGKTESEETRCKIYSLQSYREISPLRAMPSAYSAPLSAAQ